MRVLVWQVLAALFLVSGGSFASPSKYAYLADRKPEKIEEPGLNRGLSQRLFKRITKAQLLLADEKFEDSLSLLARLEKSTQSKPFALAQVYQIRGFVYAQQSKWEPALQAFEKSLALKAMPLAGTLSTMMTTAQVYMATEKFEKAVPLIQDVIFNAETKRPQQYVALAQCFTALKMHKAAIGPIKTAISLEEKPKETWYQLLVALHYQLKEYDEAVRQMLSLININPDKKKYWQQLSSLYLASEKDVEAVASLEVAYKRGYLEKEKDILRFVSLLYHNAIPWKAAKILEASIKEGKVAGNRKNYEMLSNFWSESKDLDKALSYLDLAAPLSKNGRIYIRQGNLYLMQEDWQKARDSLVKGIKKGGLRNEGFAHLSLGVSHYNLKDFKEAKASFQTAKKVKETKEQAKQWLNHLEEESI